MCITIKQGGKHALKMAEYKARENQTFKFVSHNGRWAFLNSNSALCLYEDSAEEGGKICLDEGQHASSYFEVLPVTEGEWTGKACLFRTHCGMSFDIGGGQCTDGADVVQWPHHGGPNQMWIITPADEHQKKQKKQRPQPEPAQEFGGWGGFGQPQVHDTPLVEFQAGRAFFIRSEGNPDKCMHIVDHGEHMGRLAIHDWNGGINQKFYIAPHGERNHFLLRCQQGNLFVDLVEKEDQDGSEIFGSNQFNGSTTAWLIEHKPDCPGVYTIKSPFNRGIDVGGNNYNNENLLIHW